MHPMNHPIVGFPIRVNDRVMEEVRQTRKEGADPGILLLLFFVLVLTLVAVVAAGGAT